MRKDLLNLIVDEYTSPCPWVASTTTPLAEIIETMKREGIRHVPIIENNQAVGIITDRDLKVITNEDMAQKYSAQDLMVENPYVVTPNTPLHEVAFYMSENKIGSALILDDDGKINGIFTATDALNALVEVLRGEVQ